MAKVKWVVVAFGNGKRRTVDIPEPKRGIAVVKQLREKGLKAHLVSYNHPTWPKADDDMSAAGEGKVWCPYCRAWRWFSVPKYHASAKDQVGTELWFLNSFNLQQVRICQWCWVSEGDWYVKQMNGLFDREPVRKRRRRRRK